MSAENERIVRRFFEEFCNGRRAEVADEIIAPEYVSHGPQAPPAVGPEGVRERVGRVPGGGGRSVGRAGGRFRSATAWLCAGSAAGGTRAS